MLTGGNGSVFSISPCLRQTRRDDVRLTRYILRVHLGRVCRAWRMHYSAVTDGATNCRLGIRPPDIAVVNVQKLPLLDCLFTR